MMMARLRVILSAYIDLLRYLTGEIFPGRVPTGKSITRLSREKASHEKDALLLTALLGLDCLPVASGLKKQLTL